MFLRCVNLTTSRWKCRGSRNRTQHLILRHRHHRHHPPSHSNKPRLCWPRRTSSRPLQRSKSRPPSRRRHGRLHSADTTWSASQRPAREKHWLSHSQPSHTSCRAERGRRVAKCQSPRAHSSSSRSRPRESCARRSQASSTVSRRRRAFTASRCSAACRNTLKSRRSRRINCAAAASPRRGASRTSASTTCASRCSPACLSSCSTRRIACSTSASSRRCVASSARFARIGRRSCSLRHGHRRWRSLLTSFLDSRLPFVSERGAGS
mmetsp:Transcript_11558/g.29220  ORF Transcript_11558/g.29220 Transcript_11558/m.29220 type:complete len:265 (+) Transcript_11558:250-1044(+)